MSRSDIEHKTGLTLLPAGCTSVAATALRSKVRPAPRMGDLCRQVSWLAAQAPCSDLPDTTFAGCVSGHNGAGSPHTVAGAATELATIRGRTAFPFHPQAFQPAETVTPSKQSSGQRSVNGPKAITTKVVPFSNDNGIAARHKRHLFTRHAPFRNRS